MDPVMYEYEFLFKKLPTAKYAVIQQGRILFNWWINSLKWRVVEVDLT